MFYSYNAAIGAGDGAGACAEMAPSLQQQMVSAIGTKDPALTGRPCTDILKLILSQGGATVQGALSLANQFSLTNLHVSGDHATMTGVISIGGRTIRFPAQAQRIGGRWLLSCCVPGHTAP